MRRGKIDARVERGFEGLIAMKFRAVVERNGVDGVRLRTNQALRARIDCRTRAAREFPDQGQARFPIHERENAGATLTVAEHGVALPVAQSRAIFCPRRARRNRTFSSESSSTVIVRIPLPKRFVRAPQMDVQRAALFLVGPDVSVDGFMADRQPACARIPPDDLLGAPILAQQQFNRVPIGGTEPRITPRVRPARRRVGVRGRRLVVAVAGFAVALELARDGTAMSVELAPNRGGAQPLHPEGMHRIPFSFGDLVVRHLSAPLSWRTSEA